MARQWLAPRAFSDVMTGHAHAASGAAFWPVALMWFGMMSAMMAPTAWPWVRTFHRLNGAGIGATARFVSGYLLAWLSYAIAAALFQVALQRTASMPAGEVVSPGVGAVVFLIAGLYQFAP